MPTLKQLACSIELGGTNSKLTEYGTKYSDGHVETFVAVPQEEVPFSIHLESEGYIAPGLAMFVYMDGKYQCNRNRRGLLVPGSGVAPEKYEVDLRVRQKEAKQPDGSFLGREWTFHGLNLVSSDKNLDTSKEFLENVGTIEVVVLRCKGAPVQPQATQPRSRPGQSAPADVPRVSKEPSSKQSAKAPPKAPSAKHEVPSIKESKSAKPSSSKGKPPSASGTFAFGGLVGVFDGAADEPDSEPVVDGWERQLYDNPWEKNTATDKPTPPGQHVSDDDEGWSAFDRHEGPSYTYNRRPFPPEPVHRFEDRRQYYSTSARPGPQESIYPSRSPRYYEQYRPNNRASAFDRNMEFYRPAPEHATAIPQNAQVYHSSQPRFEERIRTGLLRQPRPQYRWPLPRDKAVAHRPAPSNVGSTWCDRTLRWTESIPGPESSFSAPRAGSVRNNLDGDPWPDDESIKNMDIPKWSPKPSVKGPQKDKQSNGEEKPKGDQTKTMDWTTVPAANNEVAPAENWNAAPAEDRKGPDNDWGTAPVADADNQDNNWGTTPAAEADDQDNNWGTSPAANEDNQDNQDNNWGTTPAEADNQDNNDAWETPAQEAEEENQDSQQWGAVPAEDNNDNTQQDWANSAPEPKTPQKKTKSSKSKTHRSAPNLNHHDTARSATKPAAASVDGTHSPSKPIPKPYWSTWNTQPNDSAFDADTHRFHYLFPEEALPRLPTSVAQTRQLSHQIKTGKGAPYIHLCSRPEYLDDMSKPYAVFTFKYRSRDVVEEMFGIRIKADGSDLKAKLADMTKDELAEELFKLRVSSTCTNDVGEADKPQMAKRDPAADKRSSSVSKVDAWMAKTPTRHSVKPPERSVKAVSASHRSSQSKGQHEEKHSAHSRKEEKAGSWAVQSNRASQSNKGDWNSGKSKQGDKAEEAAGAWNAASASASNKGNEVVGGWDAGPAAEPADQGNVAW